MPPMVETPLPACRRAVTVGNVLDGSNVTLKRSSGVSITGCFQLSTMYFQVEPFIEGEWLTASQEFPDCGLSSLDSKQEIVGPSEPIPVPSIMAPICEGSSTVTINNLLIGSKIRIFLNGTELGTAEASGASSEFDVFGLIEFCF